MNSEISAKGSDFFDVLRLHTNARIGLGRFGQGLPSQHALDYQRCHALARDAVHKQLDAESLARALDATVLKSRAIDRAQYLQRPDLGRRLDPQDREALAKRNYDVAIVVGDGLSAVAVERNVIAFLAELSPLIAGLSVAPMTIVLQARVAVGDEVAERLGARIALMLLGERPGLSSPDSLGAYLTFAPCVGRRDDERNCVSNIRPEGLPPLAAAKTIAWLIRQAMSLKATGITLKDESDLKHAMPLEQPGAAIQG